VWIALASLTIAAVSGLGCGSVTSANDGGTGGTGQCPSGQIWCPGCTPGTGICATGCPGIACPPIDGGCTGTACPVDASMSCTDVTTLEACDQRPDCHSVFVDRQDCQCGGIGCCARFLRCADGDTANCSGGAVLCDALTPHCEGQYVVSYTASCYEGCVRMTECAP
jgi:hypothetical protein